MVCQFRNLVCEGGGVKGIAYVGAMQVLEERGALEEIQRIGGTSAGAINATLIALGYSTQEQMDILRSMDFSSFMDDSGGIFRDVWRLIRHYGWHAGDVFEQWMRGHIAAKLGNAAATFRDAQDATGGPELYMYGTNLNTGFGELYSTRHTPDMPIARAVRISMSIPLFFTAMRNQAEDILVDGGVLHNYPIKLFDREGYIDASEKECAVRDTEYYTPINQTLAQQQPEFDNRYVYNKQTLGIRLDSKAEIAVLRDGAMPRRSKIKGFKDYVRALLHTTLNAQENMHLHTDDWHRTVYVDTLGVSSTDFDLSSEQQYALIDSGRKHTQAYFAWFDRQHAESETSPINKIPLR